MPVIAPAARAEGLIEIVLPGGASVDAAMNGRAEAIVTFNKRDFGAAPASFGLRLLTPGEAAADRRHGGGSHQCGTRRSRPCHGAAARG